MIEVLHAKGYCQVSVIELFGYTIIGAGKGLYKDRDKPNHTDFARSQIEYIEEGKYVTVHFYDRPLVKDGYISRKFLPEKMLREHKV